MNRTVERTSVNSRRQGRPSPPAPGHRLPPRWGWTRPRSPRSAVAAAWGSIAGKSWSSVGLEEKREMGSFNDFRVERGARIMHSLSASDWKRESHWADFFQSTTSIKSWLCLIPIHVPIQMGFRLKGEQYLFPLQFKRRERLKMEHPPPPRHNGFRRGGGKEEGAFIPILPFHYFFQRIGMSGRIMVRNGNLSNSKLLTTLFGVHFAALFSIHEQYDLIYLWCDSSA